MSNPQLDMRQLIIDIGIADANQVVVGQRTETIDNTFQIVVRMMSGTPNPKWQIDDISMSFQVIGDSRNNIGVADNKVWELHDALLGLSTQTYGNTNYTQFNVETMPNFIGLSDANAEPQFIMTMNINRQIQVATGNRLPL